MTIELVKALEARLNVLEFKLELALKLSKIEVILNLEECKTMDEFAFVTSLNKSEYNAINELLSSQIQFFKMNKQKSYINPRQVPKVDPNLDVFVALSSEAYESAIWEIIPRFNGNVEMCHKIATINGIHELYYDLLATEIKRVKYEKLDKEAKLLSSYKDFGDQIDHIYKEVENLNLEFASNVDKMDEIILFFNQNELIKISNFYNGELWDRSDEDKRVVINENTYIHNVCKTDGSMILNKINDILTSKDNGYKDLLIHLLQSSPTSSKKIDTLLALYKTMDVYNKNEHVQLDEIISLKEQLLSNKDIVGQIINLYNEFIGSL